MKLEEQVVSLELAKKLKELGVRQDGHFDWYEHEGIPYVADFAGRFIDPLNGHHEKLCSAFTVAELGEMFKSVAWTYWHDNKKCWIGEDDNRQIEADTEANARAKMLIFLIEKKIVTI